jgi:transaldolase
MNAIRQLRELGQSLWLDNITRELIDKGGLARYIEEFSVTGLTSNPTIFDEAIGAGKAGLTESMIIFIKGKLENPRSMNRR